MGTILQERVSQQYLERVSATEREWKKKKKASWSNNMPNVDSFKMGRRQSQKRTLQPQNMFPRQESIDEKISKLQQRRKHKPDDAKHNTSPQRPQGTSDSHPPPPAEDRVELKVQPSPKNCSCRDDKITALRPSRRTPAFPCYGLTDSCPDLLDRLSPNPEGRSLSSRGESDSDTDLSESERRPASRCGRVPPQLELRPEVIEAGSSSSSGSHRPRGRSRGAFDFPDFLPPPFNSWSLSQLAVLYNTEGRGASGPRPLGPLERYLERLLQLEWYQIQTCQEESGKSDVLSSCHRSPAAASSRLSAPKCILQCQRGFPLTFLSSLAGHSALLTGCACAPCCIRYSTRSKSCCRSTRIHTRQSRLSPLMEHRGPTSLPKRSHSESRMLSSDRRSASQTQRFSSPARTSSHLRRMQASGNIRSAVQGADTKPRSTARDASVGAARGRLPAWGDMSDHRTGGLRRRGGSEQRRGRLERQGASEKRQSGSECRGGGAERRRTAELREQDIKPDAVTAIMDNLPGCKKNPINRPNKVKQVEFVT